MEASVIAWAVFAYFATKYILATVMLWFVVHLWVTGKFKRVENSYMDFGLTSRPWLLVGLMFLPGATMFYLVNHLKYPEPYFNLLRAGEPFLYSWSALASIMISSGVAFVMYSRKSFWLGGTASMIAFTLVALCAPYYSLALLR